MMEFQEHGFKKQAMLLKKRVKELEDCHELLQKENQIMKTRMTERYVRVNLERSITLRREHLITLHNALEHCRCFGELIPHEDYRSLGFNDHRTLHRSCNRFVDEGFLIRQRSNPTIFRINPEAIQSKLGDLT